MEKTRALTPRVRARVGMGDDNKYYFEITLWTLDGKTMISKEPFCVGPFETENQAHDEMQEAVKQVADTIERTITGSKVTSGMYYDLKDGGRLKPWPLH